MGAAPAFALAGDAGARGLTAMAIDLPAAPQSSRHRTTGRAVNGAGSSGVAPAPDPDEMEEEHVETWRLVRLAQDGDGEAFGQLYDRYVEVVFRFVYFRVNDRALAEDFTSETFLRALRRISTISYQGRDIGAWFITIARNIVLDHMKSARHRLEVTTADTLESTDREPSTEDAVLGSLTSEHLMAAVRQLGDEQRECVMLRFIQGFSVSETAAVMGKNDGAIKALQHRAVRKLAELVSGDFR
jgi:RNA polymerase sigma-70 factor (ECF subfamily)